MGDEDTCVRVAVRIRPQIAREKIDMCRVCTTVTPGEPQVTLGTDKSFTYDYVFDMDSTQQNVYDRCVASLVDGSLQGYNATILAYGQTGSGKTYSMGSGFDVDLQPEQVGIIPRAIGHLFEGIRGLCEAARENGQPPPEFKVVAQFMELYNEELIDLFDPGRDYKGKTPMKIHEDASGNIYVSGVTSRAVTSADDALELLRVGAVSRTTGSTQMNSQSSRSHAIFTLHVKQQRLVKIEDSEPEDNGMNEFETLTAKFHFVDLAGSERLKRTGATGERAKEGISINCGLLALGNVISALGDKAKKALHVPYRDSKLTRLLQDSLGGNSQTVMIACISPSDRDFMETLNTLNYANRARNIKNKVVVNQDKSSRTISLLRQEIQQLQLELLEYKQGKRVVGEDGTETVNDMFHENTMLQSEVNNLRTRVKALQETVEVISTKNTQLLAEKATGIWLSGSNSDGTDITEMVQGYLKEIEELRAKLLESEATCQQLRKSSMRPRGSISHGNPFDMFGGETSNVTSLIEEAKRELAKQVDRVSQSNYGDETGDEKKNGVAEDEGSQADIESDTSDTEDKARDTNEDDSDSDTDSDEKEENEMQQQYGLKLAELNSEMNIKQKLIEELEQSQRRLQTMRQHYEDKVLQLQERIKATEEERDKMLASYSGTNSTGGGSSDKMKRIKDEYERKLTDMQKELKRLQTAKKEHARLLQNQRAHENQLRNLKNDLSEMKRAKVKLMNKIKEESQRHKQLEMQRNREIAQLRKETRKHENQIRSLEQDKKIRDAMIRRKNEEVTALRRVNRGNLSNKAAGRVSRNVSRNMGFLPRVAKQKWQKLEKTISKVAINKQVVTSIEREMERQLQERERLGRARDDLLDKISEASKKQYGDDTIKDLSDQLEVTNANIEYIQYVIKESQQTIVEVEDSKENSDSTEIDEVVQNIIDIEEAKYLITKLYNMSINQTYEVALRESNIKETEAELRELKQQNNIQQQLLQHVYTTPELSLYPTAPSQQNNSQLPSSNSSATSSRSTSPTDNVNKNNIQAKLQKEKIRGRKTRGGCELLSFLYGDQGAPEDGPSVTLDSGETPDLLQPPSRPINRVPSAPGSLKTMTLPKPDPIKPSPAMSRKVYERQDSTSPRPSRRTLQTNLLGKPGSMEQGIDASPPQSPPAFRRLTSREENVFSRLTSSTTASNDQPTGQGIISTYQGKVAAKAPLICTHVAEGHSRAVLSVDATDDLLFSSSKDRTVKVWDLQTGVERQSLGGHPNNVTVVRYHEESRLVFSVSSAYVKVWDLRDAPTKCIQTLCSSGLSLAGPISLATASHSLHLPPGESQLNDVALNHNGRVLYTASGDKVRVWDLRRYEATGKLSGGHQAAIMCLAVGKLSEEEDVVITGSKDHYIKVFEVNRAAASVFTPKMNLNPPHYDGIQSLAIQGDILFSGSRDMCIKKWDLSKQELVQSLNNAHKDWVCGLAFMPGSQILVSGCRAGTLKLWSAETCNQLGEMKAHGSPINAITTNSSHIFTASNDDTIRIWKRNGRFDYCLDPSGSV
ncbi:hypothetical protein R5R35_013851 [Gryllus longicercus]|uniref:Kinesin motor domain-containing protein n=1 Tax=Gryllus longicercus TaxID=2509291 RepID=A0AAN9VA19_9ORTH